MEGGVHVIHTSLYVGRYSNVEGGTYGGRGTRHTHLPVAMEVF